MSIFPTKILLATDGSEEAASAARAAAELSEETGSEVHVCYVLPTEAEVVGRHFYSDEIRESVIEQAERDARSFLEEQAQRVSSEGGKVAETHLRVGRPDKEILRLAGVLEAGTIVMGSRGLGAAGRALMGSVSDSVVRHAHCPVMVMRGEPVVFPTKILLATDGSREAELAARTAADLGEKTGSELHLVHVFGIAPVGPPVYPEATDLQGVEYEAEAEERQRISEQRAREVLEAEVEKVRSTGGMVAQAHLLEGRVAPEVVALAEEIGAGLIVIGSRGHGGIRRALMGSVSDSVVRHAHCPVLVVRE
jgi:nucleotide-binding universal stress UspA family protein